MSATHASRRASEDWEDWMDWDKTVDIKATRGTEQPPRTSSDGIYQLPSPQASTVSEQSLEHSRKRKVSTESERSTTTPAKKADLEETSAQNKSHSIVEKRYRNNLNQKIADLGECIPILRHERKGKDGLEAAGAALKHNKATVLTEAITYIQYLERRNAYLEQVNAAMQERSRNMMSEHIPVQEEVKVEEVSSSFPDRVVSPSLPIEEIAEGDETSTRPIQGMIKVPEEWRRLWRGELGPYASETVVAPRNDAEKGAKVSVRGGKYVGRLMVGSLAGLMVMDGFAANWKESSDDRGLFALPLFRHLPDLSNLAKHVGAMTLGFPSTSNPHSHLFVSLLKAFFIFGVLGLMLFIYLFNSEPPARKGHTTPQPKPAPSLASPLEVRQRAFLTSIQTVWVPRHHVLPEMLALNVETAAYLIRQLLGWQMYSWLTGRSEDEEIARVRAWDIAIDAQLSGGDPEISKSRLVLTLWASGTLPCTPARLMLKALHIRVLFWQPSRMPWLTRLLHKAARRLSRWQWKKACKMQRKVGKVGVEDAELLSDHLKALLQHPSDTIMSDKVIQRAHNLVWNRSIGEGTNDKQAEMDEVTEDTAMRGPLDALASWHSNIQLASALRSAMDTDNTVQDNCNTSRIDDAVRSALPGSSGRTKALAARAVLQASNRQEHIQQMLHSIAPAPILERSKSQTLSPRSSSSIDAIPDADNVDISACAKCARALDVIESQDSDVGIEFDASPTLQFLQSHAHKMGLLGYTAAHQILLVLQRARALKGHNEGSIRTTLQNMLIQLQSSRKSQRGVLDAQVCGQITSAFRRMLSAEKHPRRMSEMSNDTGYASMSSDDDDDDEAACGTG